MTTAEERKALNEGTFREANETLEQGARAILASDDRDALVPFLCECPAPECREVVFLTLDEYAEVRAVGERGLARIGHDDPTVEHVVARNDRFVTTEKFGRAGAIHAANDPKT